jgi:hypothetical protein
MAAYMRGLTVGGKKLRGQGINRAQRVVRFRLPVRQRRDAEPRTMVRGGAALMTETRMEMRIVSAVSNILANRPLEEALQG